MKVTVHAEGSAAEIARQLLEHAAVYGQPSEGATAETGTVVQMPPAAATNRPGRKPKAAAAAPATTAAPARSVAPPQRPAPTAAPAVPVEDGKLTKAELTQMLSDTLEAYPNDAHEYFKECFKSLGVTNVSGLSDDNIELMYSWVADQFPLNA